MKKTPETTSRARQRLGAEIAVWRAGIAAARRDTFSGVNAPAENAAKVTFGEKQIARCTKEMKKLGRQAKKPFWSEKNS